MLTRLMTRELIRPEQLTPSDDRLKVVSVLNPGVAEHQGDTVMLLRIAEEPANPEPCKWVSPRYDEDHQLQLDTFEPDDRPQDPRVYEIGEDRILRLRFISHLRVVRSSDPYDFDVSEGIVLKPELPYEEFGIEDPRITQIGSTYYITYVAASRHGAATALMSTTDFVSFQRHGIIFPPDNKDVLLFPEKIADTYIAMHRPMNSMKFCAPKIWLARSNNLTQWGAHEPMIIDPGHMSDRMGGSTPPIKTNEGWLTLYHGSERSDIPGKVGRYTASAMMLDLNNPSLILGKTKDSILVPTEPFETHGYVDDVIFPTAMIPNDDKLDVYYGAADTSIGVTSFDRQSLLDAIEPIS